MKLCLVIYLSARYRVCACGHILQAIRLEVFLETEWEVERRDPLAAVLGQLKAMRGRGFWIFSIYDDGKGVFVL